MATCVGCPTREGMQKYVYKGVISKMIKQIKKFAGLIFGWLLLNIILTNVFEYILYISHIFYSPNIVFAVFCVVTALIMIFVKVLRTNKLL